MSPIFYPIDPAVLSVEMRILKGAKKQPASDLPPEYYDDTVASDLDNIPKFEERFWKNPREFLETQHV